MKTGVVLITGCSRGLGQDAALALARRGWTVVATLRGVEGRADLEAAGVEVVTLDVTDEASVRAVVEQTAARHGRLDAVVANAGRGIFGCFEDVDMDQARAVFDVNVFGVFHTAASALPHLRASRGTLVVISSVAGKRSTPGSSIYNASKAAVEGWGEALALELDPFGVRVVLVEPGATESGFATSVWTAARAGSEPYADITERLGVLRREAFAKPDPASVVTDAVVRALTDPDPPLRIPTGKGTRAQILAVQLLPWSIYRAVARWKLRFKAR